MAVFEGSQHVRDAAEALRLVSWLRPPQPNHPGMGVS